MSFEIRQATPADAGGIAAIWRATMPQLVKTAAGVEAELRGRTARRLLVAADNTGPAGFASAWLPREDDPAASSRLAVQVSPDRQRRGIGSALARSVVDAAVDAGARHLLTVVEDTAAARDFAIRHGFAIGRQQSFSRAVLADVPEPLPVPDGLDLVTFEQLADPRQVWEASAAGADDPSGLSGIAAYDEWLTADWRHPDHARDLSTALLDGDRVVSLATVQVDRDRGVVWSNLTGTVAAYRGRGLAKVVKSAALGRCRDAGLRLAFTGNDAENRPMLAVNSWLGYHQAGTQWTADRAA